MTWSTVPMQLEGLPNVREVIKIDYQIYGGTNKQGVRFSGDHRTAFLPNNKDGVEILTLFAEAFRRKLIFKVGTSITTGA